MSRFIALFLIFFSWIEMSSSLKYMPACPLGKTSFVALERRNMFRLNGGKHLASSGMFIDMFPRPKDKKMEELLEDLKTRVNLQEEAKTGTELRAGRNRNLIELKAEIDEREKKIRVVSIITGPQRKKSVEEILTLIESLNDLYNSKSSLTNEESLGLFDFDELMRFVMAKIPFYEEENRAKNLKSWILYHRRKKDIIYNGGKWIWTSKL